MRAITPVFSVLLVAVLAVALISFLWLYMTGTLNSLTFTGTSTVNQSLTTISSCMKIESVYGNQVSIRNCGKGVINTNDLTAYLDDVLLSSKVNSSVYFKDGFESHDTSAWTFDNGGDTISSNSYQGKYSHETLGLYQYPYIYEDISSLSPTQVYMRFYYKIESNPSSPGDEWQISSDGIPRVSVKVVNIGGSLRWRLMATDNSPFWPPVDYTASTGPIPGQWYSVEYWFKPGMPHGAKLWINGVLTLTSNDTTNVPPSFLLWRMGLGGIFVSNNPTVPNQYFDDVVISNSYIGPESSNIINEGQTGTITLPGLWNFNPGSHTLRVTSPRVIAEEPVNAVLPDSNVLALEFDEGSGNAVNDFSGNGNNGVLGDGTCSPGSGSCPSWLDGKFGKALSFDGANDYVDAGNSSSLSLEEFSIEAWVKTGQTTGAIVSKSTGNSYNYVLRVISGYANLEVYDGSNYQQAYSYNTINDGNWHHIVGVRDSNKYITVYLDGIAGDTVDTSSFGAITNIVSLLIGRKGGTSVYFNGVIDSVRIYNQALTPDQTISLRPVSYD